MTDIERGRSNDLIDDTISTLMTFIREIVLLSKKISESSVDASYHTKVAQLAEWLDILLNSVKQIKAYTGLNSNQSVLVLEKDLIEIVRDIVEARTRDSQAEVQKIIGDDLVDNLEKWYRHGIPHIFQEYHR